MIGACVIGGLWFTRGQQSTQKEAKPTPTVAKENISISPSPSEPQKTAVLSTPLKKQSTISGSSQPTATRLETLEAVVPKSTPIPIQTQSFLPPTKRQSSINNQSSPADAVQNYYSNINQGQYSTAWNQLTPSYQNNKRLHPNGYLSYIDWWGGKVKRVDVGQVNIVDASTERATVNTQLRYVMKTGQVVSNSVNLFLLWDADNSRWVVTDAQ